MARQISFRSVPILKRELEGKYYSEQYDASRVCMHTAAFAWHRRWLDPLRFVYAVPYGVLLAVLLVPVALIIAAIFKANAETAGRAALFALCVSVVLAYLVLAGASSRERFLKKVARRDRGDNSIDLRVVEDKDWARFARRVAVFAAYDAAFGIFSGKGEGTPRKADEAQESARAAGPPGDG